MLQLVNGLVTFERLPDTLKIVVQTTQCLVYHFFDTQTALISHSCSMLETLD